MALDATKSVPAELWARIFGVLQPRFRSDRQQPAQHQFDLKTNQSSFWQLPSVCKAFQATFNLHPELCSQFCITDCMLDKAELSLLAWLRTRSTVLTSLQAVGTHTQIPQCLLALSDHGCPLEFASVTVASQAVINSMGTFGALTTCALRGTSDDLGGTNLDLLPLQWLAPLKSLQLEKGRFINVNAVSHLTRLEVSEARVIGSSDCNFCSSLVKLQLKESGNISMHAMGLCACTVLQCLEMGLNCIIHARAASIGTLAGGAVGRMFPASMSCLTALTNLSLAFCDECGGRVDFAGISSLSNLQALGLESLGNFMLHPEIGALTKLTTLYLCAAGFDTDDKAFVDISLNWKSLLALQRLSVLSYLTCDESVFGLAELEHLDTVDFVEAAPLDSVSRNCLATLKQRLNCRLYTHPANSYSVDIGIPTVSLLPWT
ncbi:hypothetical protein ABBQ32_007396 [Trebouxia sp. C0010 RCD-2024]